MLHVLLCAFSLVVSCDLLEDACIDVVKCCHLLLSFLEMSRSLKIADSINRWPITTYNRPINLPMPINFVPNILRQIIIYFFNFQMNL